MAIRWDLLQPVDIGARFNQGYQMGQQMVERERVKSALSAFAANPTDPAAQNALAAASPEFAMKLASHNWERQEKEAERQRIASFYGGNRRDSTTAARRAYEAGDPEVGARLLSLSKEERAAEEAEAKALAPFALRAMQLPYEQRKAFIESQRPQLNQIGLDDEEIAAFDPTDNNLGGIVQRSLSVEEMQQRQKITWHTPMGGKPFATDFYGNVIDPTKFRAGPGYSPGQSGSGEVPGGGATSASPAPAGTPGDLSSFRDPGYDTIEASLEAKYPQLPKGLLARIRTRGERSNAGEVSSAGAQTVYQVIPDTRAAFQKRYGIDAYSSPEAAAEVAALHLLESIQRGEDPVRGYIGGPDQSNWGPQTAAYADRVGPVSLPSNPIAKAEAIRKQAHEAIAAGAPEAEVRARAASMGVSL
jgi:hypothetical protein